MRVRLLHFASFREAVGRDEEVRDFPEGTRVQDLWGALAARGGPASRHSPPFRRPPSTASTSGSDTVLRDGDEVAFLPPVAGG